MLQAERKLEEAEQKLAALAAPSSSNETPEQQQQLLLTPRPTEWGEAQALAEKCKVGAAQTLGATSCLLLQLLEVGVASLCGL
jgi:hypothetical protein